jgi:hypothetical protein
MTSRHFRQRIPVPFRLLDELRCRRCRPRYGPFKSGAFDLDLATLLRQLWTLYGSGDHRLHSRPTRLDPEPRPLTRDRRSTPDRSLAFCHQLRRRPGLCVHLRFDRRSGPQLDRARHSADLRGEGEHGIHRRLGDAVECSRVHVWSYTSRSCA